MRKIVVLMRHGKDEKLREPTYPGEDVWGLGEIGQQQVTASARWLESLKLGRICAHTSGTKRARDSAEITADILKAPVTSCHFITNGNLRQNLDGFRAMMNGYDKDPTFDALVLVTHSPDWDTFTSKWGHLWGLRSTWFSYASAWVLYPDRRVDQFHPDPRPVLKPIALPGS